MLVSGLVIFFAVVRGGSTVGVCGEFVVFGSSLVRVVWHGVPCPWSPLILERFEFSKLYNKEHSRRGHAFSNQMKMTVEWIWSRLPPLAAKAPWVGKVILAVFAIQQMGSSGYQLRRTHPSLARYLLRRARATATVEVADEIVIRIGAPWLQCWHGRSYFAFRWKPGVREDEKLRALAEIRDCRGRFQACWRPGLVSTCRPARGDMSLAA